MRLDSTRLLNQHSDPVERQLNQRRVDSTVFRLHATAIRRDRTMPIRTDVCFLARYCFMLA
jgi:hypothetical protein